ncbi:MAG: TniQ family protein [Ruminococcus sp.]|nr:TniQ family protein [Ruminococcus sp.]
MIAYLPEIYPDELVYSWFCRYYIHTGCITNTMAFQELLYNRCNNPSKEFIGHLNTVTAELIQRLFAIDDLIINHTMYPQYARFIPLQQKKKALYHIGYDFCDVHHLFAILPRTQSDSRLKYCPLCVQEDRKKHGEAYWHRKHQIRNMSICTKHKCLLVNSDITAKSEQSFTLNPAEITVNLQEPEYENNTLKVAFSEYMVAVFDAPINFESNIPISAVLYNAMKKTKYMKQSGKSRYTKRFVDDMQIFYKNIGIGSVASMSQVQRVLLQDRFDFSVVCQIAFFLNMGVDDLTVPTLTNEQIEQEQNSHYMKGRETIDWAVYDNETAPILEQIAYDIYTGIASETGRPERVSEKIIYRELGLPGHRLDNLPKCKTILAKYSESYQENWARRIIWAYNKLKSECSGKPFYWSDIRRISGVKKHNLEFVLPYISKHTDKKTAKAILKICQI